MVFTSLQGWVTPFELSRAQLQLILSQMRVLSWHLFLVTNFLKRGVHCLSCAIGWIMSQLTLTSHAYCGIVCHLGPHSFINIGSTVKWKASLTILHLNGQTSTPSFFHPVCWRIPRKAWVPMHAACPRSSRQSVCKGPLAKVISSSGVWPVHKVEQITWMRWCFWFDHTI